MAMGPFFYMLPTKRLIGLREIWPDTSEYLNKHASKYFDDYGYSGYCIYQLIQYLKANKNIDLGDSKYHLLFPTALFDGVWFIDNALKDKYAGSLDSTLFSGNEVRSVLLDLFNGDAEESSKAASQGLRILNQSLEMVSDSALMIIRIIP